MKLVIGGKPDNRVKMFLSQHGEQVSLMASSESVDDGFEYTLITFSEDGAVRASNGVTEELGFEINTGRDGKLCIR